MLNIKRLPAEWEEQEFVQLIFPHKDTDWAEMLDEASGCFCEIIKAILQFEDVLVICADSESVVRLRNATAPMAEKKHKIKIANIKSNDTWARDTAPITVFDNNSTVLLDFTFNGWGLKFPANLDNQISSKLFHKQLKTESKIQNHFYRDCRNFILEGGSIESDGKGTILTTSKCLLSDNRNCLNKTEIEKKLKEYLGAKRILWLNHGYLAGDDTDSHIDTLARFCNENTIAYVKCEDSNDEHFAELEAMENELKTFRTFDNKPYNLVALPMADKVIFNGERLPATYANFLLINGAVLLPTYNSLKDRIANEILQNIFTDRKIVNINSLPLIKQHGSLHCVTMQFPKKNNSLYCFKYQV
jgi:agmatine/peptidylarginine deiminase